MNLECRSPRANGKLTGLTQPNTFGVVDMIGFALVGALIYTLFFVVISL